MSASLTSHLQREAADEAAERMDDARADWMAVIGEDGESAAYNKWQAAMQAFRAATNHT